MAEAKRKKGETFESFLRRFNKKLQQSGRMIQTRKIRFHEGATSKNKMRETALRRLKKTEEREYLKKIGKLQDDGPYRR